MPRRGFFAALGGLLACRPSECSARLEWVTPGQASRLIAGQARRLGIEARTLEWLTRDMCTVGPVLADIPIEVACMSKPWGWRPPGCPDDRYRYF